ncbi:MAG TPA: PAN domain-containing protein [Xanthomonadales bacterium]|nr:PAN domain-containing protein [Xanthomonadales bacterium]
MTFRHALPCLLALALVACGDEAPPAATPVATPAAAPAPASDVPTAANDLSVEPGMDRPGGDYRDFDLDRADPELCRTACRDDAECRAYTYVAPGVQGDAARCWLKSPAPDPEPNECCTSGAR